MTENERMSISGLLDVLNTGISLSTCHIEYAIQSNVLEDMISCLEELERYRAIGTVEDFKALKEKVEPKKVTYQIDTSGHKHEKCPACGSFHVFGKHCTECGQSIIEWWQ